MEEIKLYKTPWRAIKLLLMIIPFVILGIILIMKADAQWIGWLSILFFGGLGIPVALFHLFDKRPQIIINENGIWDRTTKEGVIKWEQIKNAYPIDINGQKFISLEVDDSFEFKHKPYKWAERVNEAIGAKRLNLSLSQIKVREDELAVFILKMSVAEKQNRANLIRDFFITE